MGLNEEKRNNIIAKYNNQVRKDAINLLCDQLTNDFFEKNNDSIVFKTAHTDDVSIYSSNEDGAKIKKSILCYIDQYQQLIQFYPELSTHSKGVEIFLNEFERNLQFDGKINLSYIDVDYVGLFAFDISYLKKQA